MNNTNPSQRNLYVCATLLNLISSLVLQMTDNAGIPADLILQDTTDFGDLAEKIRQTGLFEHVDECPCLDALNAAKAPVSTEERRHAFRELVASYALPRQQHYANLYVHLPSTASQLFFYALGRTGCRPNVYLVDEGSGTYAADVLPLANDPYKNLTEPEDCFHAHVQGIYLYEPELYVGGNEELSILPLRRINALTSDQKKLLVGLFPVVEQVQEPIIFMEGCFYGDGFISNEYDLLMKIIDQVGRENVIVKRHPRNPIDRFTSRGIKVMPEQAVPWEIMLLSQNLRGKLLVSVASTACLSPKTIYGMEPQVLLLRQLYLGRIPFLETPSFRRFFEKAEALFNQEKQIVWNPRSILEMKHQLDEYLWNLGGEQA